MGSRRHQAALGTSVVYSRSSGGPRSAGQGHPYALLLNQVRLMEDSGSIATASRVERIVGSAETFQIALEVSKVLFDLSLCILLIRKARSIPLPVPKLLVCGNASCICTRHWHQVRLSLYRRFDVKFAPRSVVSELVTDNLHVLHFHFHIVVCMAK